MRSMTGFGRGEASAASGQAVVEVKTVNHRFLEIRTRVPAELNSLESSLEKCIRSRLARGYCTVHLSFAYEGLGDIGLSKTRMIHYVEQLKDVAEQTRVQPESLMSALAAAPDLFVQPTPKASDDVAEAALRACNEALDILIRMRETEGAHMARDVESRLEKIHEFTLSISTQAKRLEQEVFEKYRSKIEGLMPSHHSPDVVRIETEAAIIAEKADINEEINRLFSHANQMKDVFREQGPIGRRMDFLIQEMSREANTIASKSVLSEITHMVVAIKGELEKMRELIQNIE